MGTVVDLSTGHPVEREHTQDELVELAVQLEEAAAMPPRITPIVAAVARVTIAAGAVSAFSGGGFGSATRIGLGRVRVFFDPPQPDTNYFPITIPINPSASPDVSARVTSWTTNYVEVKTNGGVEASGFIVQVTRNAFNG